MAGSVIGALRVNLGLDSAQFSKGIGKANSSMSQMAAKMGKWAAGVALSAGGAFSALAVGATKSAAEITRFAALANTTPQKFQEWAAGAASVGIEQDKLADILKDTTDRVGEFMQTGGGEMADFFKNIAPRVGVTAEQFRGLSGPDALQLYVSTLEKAGVNQQEFTFYMEAMADEATGLLPLLKDNGRGMAELAARAQRMGAIMSGDALSSLNQAKRAMGDMSLAATGIRNSLGAIAAPAIVSMGRAVTSAAILIHESAGTISTVLSTASGTALVVAGIFAGRYAVAVGVTAVGAMTSAIAQSVALEMALGAQSRAAALASVGTKAMAGALTLLNRAIAVTAIGALIVGAGYLVGKFIEVVRATGSMGAALKLMGDVALGVFDGMVIAAGSVPVGLEAIWSKVKAGFYGMMATLSSGWQAFLAAIAGGLRNVPGMDEAYLAVGNAAIFAGSAVHDYTLKAEEAAAAGEDAAGRAGEIAAEGMGRAKVALDALTITVQGAGESAVTTSDRFTGLGNAGAGAAAKLTPLQEVMKRLKAEGAELSATLNMSDTNAEIWRNQTEAGVSADSEAGKMIADQTRINAGFKSLKQSTEDWQQSISGAFKSFITGGSSFKDMLGQIIGKLGEMWLDKGLQGIFTGSSGWTGGILSALGIGANANGTQNWRGGLTAINERGGEIVDLPRGTRIIPHDVSKRMMQGGNAGQSSVQIVPSPYFDAVVDQRATNVAAPMVGESARAQRRSYGQYQQRFERRGTMT